MPLVVTFHGFEATMRDDHAARSFYLHRKYLRQRASLARDATLFIAVSRAVRNALLAQGFPPDRTVAQYIGVDVDRFVSDPGIERSDIVLFIGRFDVLKGGEFAIRAMAEIGRAHPAAELVMIGDGPARPGLEALAAQIAPRCRFLGFQPQDAIRGWLNRARILCVPSVTIETGEFEALGLVFLEAQAMGVPVVSFASGGIPEAVAHGVSGFLAPERDWRALAGYLALLLTDRLLWLRMSRAGEDRVRADFDLKAMTRGLEDLYRLAQQEFHTRVGDLSGLSRFAAFGRVVRRW